MQEILELNKIQNAKGGIDVSTLLPNTKIVVKTLNSTYELTIIESSTVWVQGGKYFPQKVKSFFNGSTWGGSCIKVSWIGHNMQMEFITDKGVISTSRVKNATLYGNDWSYTMDWSE